MKFKKLVCYSFEKNPTDPIKRKSGNGHIEMSSGVNTLNSNTLKDYLTIIRKELGGGDINIVFTNIIKMDI